MISFLVSQFSGILLSFVVGVVGLMIRSVLSKAADNKAVQEAVANYAGTLLAKNVTQVTGGEVEQFLVYVGGTVSGAIGRLDVAQSTLVTMLEGKLGLSQTKGP